MEFMGMWHVRGGKRRGAYRTLVEKPEGKIPFGKTRRKDTIWKNLQVGGRIILNCIFKKKILSLSRYHLVFGD